MDSEAKWGEVDAYINRTLVGRDEALDAALVANAAAGLPAIDVSPAQGKLLHLIAKMQGAKSVLEVGTLGGYSTIWLARALPASGRVVTLEYEPRHAEVARSNLARAGLSDRVEVRVGAALDILPTLQGPFDLFFIDADKVNNPNYFSWALKLSRPGSVIIVDNVVRKGALANAGSDDPGVQGARKLLEMIAAEPRVDGTAIQTVGAKGYDGFAIALVLR